MADWIVCPACALKHAARPDRACPRCKQPVDGAAALAPLPAPGAPGLPPPSAEAVSDGLPAGARIAAWVLYANVLVAIVALLITRTTPTDPGSIGNVFGLLVDLALATALVQGKPRYVGWALGRAVIGGAILTPILWSNAGPTLGILQLLYSLGLVLLLAGAPRVPRVVSGLVTSVASLVLVLSIVSSHAAARRVKAAVADLVDRGVHLDRIEHPEKRWSLPLPEGTWHSRKASMKGVDRMVAWPEEDAILLVFSRDTPEGTQLDIFRTTDLLIEAAKKSEPSLTAFERRPFPARRGSGVAVHTLHTEKGMQLDGWYVVVADGNRLAIVFALAPRERFEAVGETLLGVAEQLELQGAAF